MFAPIETQNTYKYRIFQCDNYRLLFDPNEYQWMEIAEFDDEDSVRQFLRSDSYEKAFNQLKNKIIHHLLTRFRSISPDNRIQKSLVLDEIIEINDWECKKYSPIAIEVMFSQNPYFLINRNIFVAVIRC